MRIQRSSTDTRSEVAGAKGKSEGSGRFARALEVKRKESAAQFDLPGENHDLVTQTAASQTENISAAPAPTEMERLAGEIVDRISSHETNGARSVDIQFNSQVFDGLRVTLRSTEQGQVAIYFATPLMRVASVVQKNLGSLRAALERKGIRVTQLVVSGQAG
jgi:flagellar hook-length control protein FliK